MNKLDSLPQVPATQAKQAFGEMLDRLRSEPALAITSHGRIKALMAAPEVWDSNSKSLDEAHRAVDQMKRQLARAKQAELESQRLQRHAQLAVELLSAPRSRQDALIAQARAMLKKWKDERLVSEDYIGKWEQLLGLPVKQLASAIVGDADGWGRALRQNTPFVLAPR